MTIRTILGIIAGGALVLIGYLFFFSGTGEIRNYPPRSGPIVAFGDSLVYGVGASPNHDFISLLSQKIGEPIVNLGVPGDTTEDGLARINTVIEKKPRLVLVLLGGNDYLKRKPAEETFSNVGTIIDRLHASGAVVIVLGVRGGLLSDHFDTQFEALAEEKQTGYVPDVLDGIIGHATLMSDQIHPNDKGYAIIAEKVYPTLKKLSR